MIFVDLRWDWMPYSGFLIFLRRGTTMLAEANDWGIASTQVFWEEIATEDHLIQLYQDDGMFMNLLSGYVSGGILAGEPVVVLATQPHLDVLETRLKASGFDLFALQWQHQYIAVEANDYLQHFMVNGWPNERLFREASGNLLGEVNYKDHRVRLYTETGTVLLEQHSYGASVQLEDLWNRFVQKERLCLFCAYPGNIFRQNPNASMHRLCGQHSKVISLPGNNTAEIQYVNTKRKKESL
jgi:hypothetical protein